MMRLSRYLAQAGVCSRRQAEEKILAGLVTVNGQLVDTLGTQVDEERDIITYRGRRVEIERKRYLLFYKPVGCVSTVEDPYGRPVVTDWFKQFEERLYPVARLDANPSGLLLMSNDGDFVNQMIHPRYKMEKTYQALVKGLVTENELLQLKTGVTVEGERLTADAVTLEKRLHEETVLNITIHQGKKRQVRLMLRAIGHPVVALVRIRFAFLTLEGLKPGEFRTLQPEEVERLLALAKSGVTTPKKRKNI